MAIDEEFQGWEIEGGFANMPKEDANMSRHTYRFWCETGFAGGVHEEFYEFPTEPSQDELESAVQEWHQDFIEFGADHVNPDDYEDEEFFKYE